MIENASKEMSFKKNFLFIIVFTYIKNALYNKLGFINKPMPQKKKNDDEGIRAFLFGLGLGAIGFGIMSLFTKPKCPNQKCSRPIKQGISRCPYCKTEIEWKVN